MTGFTRLRAARWFGRTMFVLLSIGWGALASAQSLDVVCVETDWKLVVENADPARNAPQVSCVMSPTGGLELPYMVFTLNHRGLPEFSPGGMQLQAWEGDVLLAVKEAPNTAMMQQPSETVEWTTRMILQNGVLTFEVVGGSSSTWGSFGGQGYLKASVSTSLTNLNGFDPAVSAGNSGVGYSANRVQSFAVKGTRAWTSTGEVLEDTTLRTIDLPE